MFEWFEQNRRLWQLVLLQRFPKHLVQQRAVEQLPFYTSHLPLCTEYSSQPVDKSPNTMNTTPVSIRPALDLP
jgi:hypothetical protein